MTITVEAFYENGVLKLSQPLPLNEREKVRVSVHRGPSVTEQTSGMIRWTGDAEGFDRLLKESENTFLGEA
jgi:predicted DNA-binding antitoxin AbrB/MazE fold protein